MGSFVVGGILQVLIQGIILHRTLDEGHQFCSGEGEGVSAQPLQVQTSGFWEGFLRIPGGVGSYQGYHPGE